MHYPSTSHHDVLIVGAGPTGLMLACELRMAGCSVLVLEKAGDPASPLKESPFGMRGLTVPTIESLDRRGMLEGLWPDARSGGAGEMAAERRPVGHFAGIDLFQDKIDVAAWSYRLPGAIETLATTMASIESVLTARAASLGVEIRRGCEVEHLDLTDGGVAVRADERRFTGLWLVGCDGARSVVRKLAGIGFVGTEPEFTGYSVNASLTDPAVLRVGRNLTADGVYIYAPPNALWMADFDGGAAHRVAPAARDHVQSVLRKVSGTDVVISALHLSTTWTDRAFQATEFRQGRVMLAGDAAHIHSPLGGQGLNLGIGDAMNLGWKLAAVLHGKAPVALLDSYGGERGPVAAEILSRSRAQVALLRPDPGSRALEAMMRDIAGSANGATYLAERISGIGLRYDLGSDHPLVGRSVPAFQLEDASGVNERLRLGGGLLLAFGASLPLRMLASRFRDRVAYVHACRADRFEVDAVIVRPDGIVSWAGGHPIDLVAAEQSLSRWFGPRSATGVVPVAG